MCQTVNSEVPQWTLASHTYPVCLHVTCKPPDCCVTVEGSAVYRVGRLTSVH